ncbi:MAG: hypothetical protein IKO53_01570 [Lachnospiraceae bacterium]|nr:hypothetical protein [Lachnospiraceae bacterium]
MMGLNGLNSFSSYCSTSFSLSNNFRRTFGSAGKAAGNTNQPDFFVRQKEAYEKEKAQENSHMHKILRDLKRKRENECENIQEKLNESLIIYDKAVNDDKRQKVKSRANYNYKEVAGKIQRAKTSVSAGQAVISAKRKVVEIKRKISSGDGDADDLQLALTHAKRMEMAARKKKHHLELEEMASNSIQRDENASRQEETIKAIKDSLVNAGIEDISKQEDEIFEEREALTEEMSAEIKDSGESYTDDMVSELNELISELDEETLEELEKVMEFFEDMEILDPHMSREDLDELKRKHRAEEQKAMLKADMDYLKGMIKHQLNKSDTVIGTKGSVSGFAVAQSSGGMPAAGTATVSAPAAAGIDVQL